MRCTYRSIGFIASALVHLAGVAALLPPLLGAGPPAEVETPVALSLAMFQPPAAPAPVETPVPVETQAEPEPEPEPTPEPEPVVRQPAAPPVVPEAVEPPPRPRPVRASQPAPNPRAEPESEAAPPRVAARPPPSAPQAQTARPAPARPVTTSAAPNPGPAHSPIRDEYLQALIQRIQRKKYYPRQARRRREEGEVLISFVIQRSGELSDLRVSRSSGHDSLDQAALKTLRKISPFRHLPPELGVERWELAVPIAYRLSR